MNALYRPLSTIAFFAIIGAVALILAPGWAPEITMIGALVTALVVSLEILLSIGALKMRGPSVYDEALRTLASGASRPADLVALERSLGWRAYSAKEFDHRVRPVLRRVALSKLGRSELPELLQPLLAGDPTSSTVRTAQIERLVTEIERL